MPKNILEDARHVEMTVDQVRKLFDEDTSMPDELMTALDEAQGEVFSEAATEAYVIIRIAP